jgi:hypothetical protein
MFLPGKDVLDGRAHPISRGHALRHVARIDINELAIRHSRIHSRSPAQRGCPLSREFRRRLCTGVLRAERRVEPRERQLA